MTGSVRPPGSGTPPPAGSLLPALAWMADRLVEAGPHPAAPVEATLPWGVDAGASPANYRHWLHLWAAYWAEHPERRPAGGLPPDRPLLSIVVPVYRPLPWHLGECVRSVLEQSYGNWELCLCDDGSGDPELTTTLAAYAEADPRIKALALEENGGISRATNKAVASATGEFVVLLDNDDVLDPDALAEIAAVADSDVDVIYSDEDKLDESDRRFMPHFKPDWDPDLLLSYPYLGHLTVVRRELLGRIGGFRPEFDGSQDYDVMLRATEVARRVVHIPRVLYHWRVVEGSAAGDAEAKPWAHQASRRVVEDAVARRGLDARVETGPFPGAYHVRRTIHGSPTVSVIIPFRDQASLTVACLDSLGMAPGHPIREVVLVDNGSVEPETTALRRRWQVTPGLRVLDHSGAFNWSAINNAAAATCDSDMLLFLNNDIEATGTDWLRALVELAQRPDVGAVGARLIYPDGTLQHAGVVLGMQGIATHLLSGMPKGGRGYFSWDRVVRGYSAVTAACMLVRRSVFEQLGGFDEDLAVGFNDVDFCLRARGAGYRVLYTPHAELTHHESVSRGLSGYHRDFQHFLGRWWELLRTDDPCYSPNLSRFEPWCALRAPGEDEAWLSTVGARVPEPRGDGPPPAGEPVPDLA